MSRSSRCALRSMISRNDGLFGREGAEGGVAEEVDEADDGGEGGAQLVRDRRDELVLQRGELREGPVLVLEHPVFLDLAGDVPVDPEMPGGVPPAADREVVPLQGRPVRQLDAFAEVGAFGSQPVRDALRESVGVGEEVLDKARGVAAVATDELVARGRELEHGDHRVVDDANVASLVLEEDG